MPNDGNSKISDFGLINEGILKKGGTNPAPISPKPSAPAGQSPQPPAPVSNPNQSTDNSG